MVNKRWSSEFFYLTGNVISNPLQNKTTKPQSHLQAVSIILQYGRHRNAEILQALVSSRMALSPVATRKGASEIPGHIAWYDGIGDKDKEGRVPAEEAEHSGDGRV